MKKPTAKAVFVTAFAQRYRSHVDAILKEHEPDEDLYYMHL